MSPGNELQARASDSATPSGQEQTANMSAPTSPTDTRHPLSRYESITSEDEGQASGYQASDTVRRRPEGQSYGMCHMNELHNHNLI